MTHSPWCCVDDCNVETHANIFVLNISLLVEDRANNPVQKAAAVPLSWSFLNGLLNYVVKELNVEEVLKSSIFVIQKAAAPKNGVEFRQGFNHTIRSSLATSCDVSGRRAMFSNSWSFLNGSKVPAGGARDYMVRCQR